MTLSSNWGVYYSKTSQNLSWRGTPTLRILSIYHDHHVHDSNDIPSCIFHRNGNCNFSQAEFQDPLYSIRYPFFHAIPHESM